MSRAVAGLLLLALVLRIAWPHADPPAEMSWSSGIYTDPAANTLTARFAAQGIGSAPGGDVAVVYPLLNAASWVTYEALGVHRTSDVLLAALLGLLSIAAVAEVLRRGPGRVAMVCALVLGATSAFLVAYSRVLMAELTAAPLLALSCGLALGKGTLRIALAGAAAVAAALLGKLNAIGFLPALLVFVWLRRGAVAGAGPAALGAAVTAAVWVLAVFLPQREAWLAAMTGTSVVSAGILPASLGAAILRPFAAYRDSWMFHQIPVVGAAGGVFALWTVSGREVLRRRVEDGSALFAFWFLSMFAYHSLFGYTAPRYFVLVALPLTACAACLVAEWWSGSGPSASRRGGGEWIVLPALAVFLGFGFANTVVHAELVLRRFVGWEESVLTGKLLGPTTIDSLATLDGNLRWGLAIGAVLLPLLLLATRRRPGGSPPDPERRRRKLRRAAVAVVSGAVVLGVGQWGWWAAHRRYAIERTSEALSAIVGPGAVVLGGIAPLLTEGTPIRPVPIFGDVRDSAPEIRAGVTHVLLAGPDDDPKAYFPDLTEPPVKVLSWTVSLGLMERLDLFRLPDSVLAGRYTPTELELGIEAVHDSEFDEAMEHFAAYRSGGGAETADLLLFEGTCLGVEGDVAGAEAKLRAALRLDPEHVASLRMLGIVQDASGDRAGALRTWLRALWVDPADPQIRDLIFGKDD